MTAIRGRLGRCQPQTAAGRSGSGPCKLCGLSMGTSARVWLKSPMGLSHRECAEQAAEQAQDIRA